MHRRTFINMTAGAATALALKSSVLAGEPEQKNPVVYPDPAVEVVDPRFAKYKVGNAAVERLYAGTRWAKAQYGLPMDAICSSATSPITEYCDGSKTRGRSVFSAARRTTATATLATGKAD